MNGINTIGVPMSKRKGDYTAYKVVKAIETKRFEVVMIELNNGAYRILSAPNADGNTDMSEAVLDFGTASLLFDMKVREFEGH